MNLKPIEKIVLPLDGSDLAATALPWVELIANVDETSIDLVSAVDSEDEANNLSTLANRLEETKQGLDGKALLVSAFAEEGNPPGVIADHAKKTEADLVVMASHGRTGVMERMLGSVSFWVIRFGTTPVMIVKPESGQPNVKTILYPLNGGLADGPGLGLAASLARNLNVPLSLVHITESAYRAPDNVEQAINDLKTQGIDAELHVEQGDPKERVTEMVNAQSGTLVVLESSSSTGIDLGKSGSFAEYMFANTKMPTIVVPQAD